ncbi:hypothetical protein G5I_12335 [Acromyrmex echinatior]|uniref:Superoxide dismutase [Cu-Zn] n=1 Tax=Acromyrmex echinatior TaxID=103372 RepID=F4X216_ACREC|nr:hypothetical protein G5I_12335 [Acromyrmex echinatior]
MAAMLKPSAEYNRRVAIIEDLRSERSATEIIRFFGYTRLTVYDIVAKYTALEQSNEDALRLPGQAELFASAPNSPEEDLRYKSYTLKIQQMLWSVVERITNKSRHPSVMSLRITIEAAWTLLHYSASVEYGLEFPCEETSLYESWNPLDINNDIPAVEEGTLDQYKMGDLSGKFGTLDNKKRYTITYNDTMLPLFGPRSILGRSIVIHKKEKNLRWACSTIERGYSLVDAYELSAIASFHHPQGFLYGYIRMTQLVYKDGSQSETIIEVNLRHPGKHNRNTTRNHNWAIYVNPVGVDAAVKIKDTRCVAAGYTWNPYFTQLADPLNLISVSRNLNLKVEEGAEWTPININNKKSFLGSELRALYELLNQCSLDFRAPSLISKTPKLVYTQEDDLYREECGPDLPLRCYVGDISSRLGPINIGEKRQIFTDLNFPLDGPVSAMGKSIIIFDKDFSGTRFACTNIEPDNNIVKYANIRKPPRFVVQHFTTKNYTSEISFRDIRKSQIESP